MPEKRKPFINKKGTGVILITPSNGPMNLREVMLEKVPLRYRKGDIGMGNVTISTCPRKRGEKTIKSGASLLNSS